MNIRDKYQVWCTRVKGPAAKQAGSRGLCSWIWNCTNPFICPKIPPKPPPHERTSAPPKLETRVPKNTLVDSGEKTSRDARIEKRPHFGCFFGAAEEPGRRLGLLECKFGAGGLGAGSSLPLWLAGDKIETCTPLGSPRTAEQEEEDDEDGSHVDNDNDCRCCQCPAKKQGDFLTGTPLKS